MTKHSKEKLKNPEMSDGGKNWNVVTGCDKYSEGCLNCYAEDTAAWLKGMGQKVYEDNGFNLTMHFDKLNWPLEKLSKKPKRPVRSFVTDMGDLFHEKVTDEFIFQTFETMLKVPQHRFYVLTKRAERLGKIGTELPWRPWIWAGVTVESSNHIDRIAYLKQLPQDVNKFLMLEPLLSDMPKLDLEGIHWVVVGGETNKSMKFREMKEKWVINIRDQVKNAGLPFMFKHWPGKTHNTSEALLEGEVWEEYPESISNNMDWSDQSGHHQYVLPLYWSETLEKFMRMEKPEIKDEKEIYFEDLPAHTQEAIIDLIVSIIKNKSQRSNK